MKRRIICSFVLLILILTQFAVYSADTTNTTSASVNPPIMEAMYSEKADLKYLLTLPAGYEENLSEKRPLILFLHGAGQRGDDLNIVKTHGIPQVYDKIENFPFITISPLCSYDNRWDYQTSALNVLLDEVIQAYNVDTDRIYLTGLSMGGNGTWEMAMCYPEKFAAIAPVCGYGDPFDIENLKYIPAWVFHGQKDTTVPIEESQRMVDALKAAGGNVEFTIYPEADHDSWTETYDNPELYKWFLQHTRSGKAVANKETHPEIVTLPKMKVAYARAFGENCETKASEIIQEFANVNHLTDARYFGYAISADITYSNWGYEALVTVNNDVKETDAVKIKEIEQGQYAYLPAGNDTENIWRTWRKLHNWLRLSEYRMDSSSELEEMIPKEDGTSLFNMYLPITPRDASILVEPNQPYYSENGLWRQYEANRINVLRDEQDYAQWTPDIKQPGFYEVAIYKPVRQDGDSKTKIDIVHATGTDTQYLDYTEGIPEWVKLGVYHFDAGTNGYVRSSAGATDTYACATSVLYKKLPEEIKMFSDVKGHWAAQSIHELAYKGIVAGFGDETFHPEGTVSVEEFIKMLITALGYTLDNGQEYWASTFINKAQELGMIREGEFADFTLPITRLQMAKLLQRSLKNDNVDLTQYNSYITDLDELSAIEKEAVLKVYVDGIITGYDDKSFRPENNMTRAEGAEVILRLIKPGKRKQIEIVKPVKDTTEHYAVNFDVPKEQSPVNGREALKVAGITASNVPQPENAPENVADNDLGTRWSADGVEEWIQIDLGESKPISAVAVAYFSGDIRQTYAMVQISNDGLKYETIFKGMSSGTTKEYELYETGGKTARYVRLVCSGNTGATSYKWTSIAGLAALSN